MPVCEICTSQNAKYKCPQCLLKYCSVNCFKKHKEDEKQCMIVDDKISTNLKEKVTAIPSFQASDEESEDKIPASRLKQLGSSEKLRHLLSNKYLRSMINYLDVSRDPWADMENAMQEPIFREFADACLETVDQPNNEIIQSR